MPLSDIGAAFAGPSRTLMGEDSMRSQFRTLQRILYAGLLTGCAVLFSGLLAGCDGPGTSADPLAPVSADQDRAQRILANLKLRLPEIASANPEIGPLSPRRSCRS